MSIRAVFFDAVGTLLQARPSVAQAYCIIGQKFGSQLTEAQIRVRFAQSVSRRFCEDLPDGESSTALRDHVLHRTSSAWEVQRWRNIVTDVFTDVQNGEALFQELWNHFASPASWQLYDDVADCWSRLADRGLRIGIASNFDDRLPRITQALSPINSCEHVFYSSQLGYRKPSPYFFRSITIALGLTPQQMLYVGDDLDADYYGATALGWNAVWLNRVTTEPSGTVLAISSLAELSELVRQI